MKRIKLSQGKYALVDNEDYKLMNSLKWSAQLDENTFYAVRNETKMHRVIMNAPVGMEVDHRDGNGLNNQRYNLRVVTHADNLKNRKVHKNNVSGYKGVTFLKKLGKWMARIFPNDKQIYIGTFSSPEDAARAYDEKAKELFGEYANLNFPEEK